MLAYRHLFHAGNQADVFKHALFAQLAVALTRKEKPLLYLDTHAGIGLYDLSLPWAQKNAEHLDGIARVRTRPDAPPALAPYLDAVRTENRGGRLRFYPGSPRIARRFLRPGDRMVLTELNRTDCARLAKLFAHDRQVHVQLMDGYQALRAFLPPKERRGLILIDSSFDRAGEFARLTEALGNAHQRFATGTYAIWYPLMEPSAVGAFERSMSATGIRKILKLELAVLPQSWRGSLRGSAMLIVNPPYEFELTAEPMLVWIWRALSQNGAGGYKVKWLVGE